jgi:hypothetical protein
MWVLRGAIGDDYLSVDRSTVAFNTLAAHQLDVAALEAEPADIDGMIEAVSLYQGDLLPGSYEEWIQIERERLQLLFERRVHTLLDKLSAASRWDDLLVWAERWIALVRAPEPAFRALMLGHARMGDRAGMAAAYQRCVQVLDEELGVLPSAETESLYRQLSKEDSLRDEGAEREAPVPESPGLGSGPAEPAANLPHPATPLIGREEELAELQRLLIDGAEHRLVTIVGPGGIGKTRLALETANTLMSATAHFPDGAYFISLPSRKPDIYRAPWPRASACVSTPTSSRASNSWISCTRKNCCWLWTTSSISWPAQKYWPKFWTRPPALRS